MTDKTIKIGKFKISEEQTCGRTDRQIIFINKDDGEGGSFPAREVEKLIEDYYEENF